MSVQFGRWNLDGKPVDRRYLERVGETLCPYGPDAERSYSDKNIAILYRAFHTTKESHSEVQPHISSSGAVITWDGLLDNRTELICELRDSLTINSTDVAIVAAGYEKWGANCFAKLIGDWALSIWNYRERSVLLAKDPIGTHHLYYSFDSNQVAWSTILDPLVLFAGKTLRLNEEYIAGWLSTFPAAHLTPCLDVHSVPPSSYVLLQPGKRVVSRYWDFDPRKQICYRSDAEYEEHFRIVFAKAIRRKLRSDRAVLAELSGGRDSSSIVCMADTILSQGTGETPRLDTISYYDDSEPNWNERPYFDKVEKERGRTGWHIDVGRRDRAGEPQNLSASEDARGRWSATPASNGRPIPQFIACLVSNGNRVLLSGIGGDEVMGGVPTPTPELEDLLARRQFGMLAERLKAWALEMRKPWFHLLLRAVKGFLPLTLVGAPKELRPATWLDPTFVRRHQAALTGYPSRTKVFGSLPSFQANIGALEALKRQLACRPLSCEPPFEKRYPFLDRDLLEFILAVPREQLVRPRQRRSLMRRALIGIVPDEILNRRGKAFVTRAPLVAISEDWVNLVQATQNMVSSSLGLLNAEQLRSVLQKARNGEDVPIGPLLRTMHVESWLKRLRSLGLVKLETKQRQRFAWQPSGQS